MKEKIYIIFKNNEEEYDDYSDWIIEIYKDKEKAENRFVELVKTNQYKKDRAIKSAKYNEDIGAYRIEEHEIENETSEAMSEEEKKAIEFIKNLIAWDVRQDLCPNKEECENLETILNLIEKLQKENEEKTILLFAGAEKVRRLEKENEELKGTLRDTQNSWFEDTKKMEKLKNQNQCYINSIQSIAPVLI